MARISPGTMTALVFAILLGLGGAFAVRQYLHKPAPQVAEEAAPQMVSVPVAATEIESGRPVTMNDIVVKRMTPEQFQKSEYAGKAFMNSSGQISGRVLKTPMAKGEVFAPSMFYPDGMAPGIAASLKPGYRGVTVPIQNIGAVAGFARPGSYVDVIFRANAVDGYPETTMTLIEGTVILAVDDKVVEGYHGAAPGNVTLAMTPTQAKALKVVEGRGDLSLTLRNPLEAEGDFVTTPISAPTTPTAARREAFTDKVTLNQLLGRKYVIEKRQLDIYSGGTKNTVEFTEAVPAQDRWPELIQTPILADPLPNLVVPSGIESASVGRESR